MLSVLFFIGLTVARYHEQRMANSIGASRGGLENNTTDFRKCRESVTWPLSVEKGATHSNASEGISMVTGELKRAFVSKPDFSARRAALFSLATPDVLRVLAAYSLQNTRTSRPLRGVLSWFLSPIEFSWGAENSSQCLKRPQSNSPVHFHDRPLKPSYNHRNLRSGQCSIRQQTLRGHFRLPVFHSCGCTLVDWDMVARRRWRRQGSVHGTSSGVCNSPQASSGGPRWWRGGSPSSHHYSGLACSLWGIQSAVVWVHRCDCSRQLTCVPACDNLSPP